MADGKSDQRRNIGCFDRNALRIGGNTAVTGQCVNLPDLRAFTQCLDDGVLASAATDDHDIRFHFRTPPVSMVEQAHMRERHDHTVRIRPGNDQIVPDGTARLGNIGHTAFCRPLDIVRKREEGVRSQRHAGDAVQVCPLFGIGKGLGRSTSASCHRRRHPPHCG